MFSTKNNLVSFLMKKSLRVLTETTGMILINLQKASGTTDYDILLQRLSAFGFSKHSVNWCQSDVTNRSFLVNLEKLPIST